jgi:ribosome biogenesis protein MAK21
MLKKGTASDKIASLSLLIIENPTMRLPLLDQLLELCRSHSNRVSELATKTAQDLFINNLMPKHRILLHFRENHVTNAYKLLKKAKSEKANPETEEEAKQHLLYWYFEDQLKKKYKELIDILKEKSENTIETVCIRAVRSLRDLIKGCAEERNTLLKLLVDKFADTTKTATGAIAPQQNSKVPARVMHYLSTLLSPGASGTANPHFVKDLDRKVAVSEATNFLYRTDVDPNLKLYCATFLNRMELTDPVDQELAQMLIKAYLKVCEVQFTKKESNANLMGAVLAGIFRAYRIARLPSSAFAEHLDMLFKVARLSEFNKAIEAIRVISVIAGESSDTKLKSRFYALLYNKLLDEGIRTSHKRQAFLIMVLRAMLDDSNINRVKSFVKRLSQTCFYSSPGYTCAVLLILRDIMRAKPALRSLFSQPEQLLGEQNDDEEEVFEDAVVEVEQEQGPQRKVVSDDLVIEGDEIKLVGKYSNSSKYVESSAKLQQEEKNTYTPSENKPQVTFAYDPRSHKPDESGADKSCLWEVLALKDYFHPSAQSFSQHLVNRDRDFNYTGNPLDEFSTTHFLDKFMYKPPKEKQINNKYAPNKGTALRQSSLVNNIRPRTMNSDLLIQTPAEMVRDDEKFFFKFMQEKERREKNEKEHSKAIKMSQDPKMRMAEALKHDRMMTGRDIASQNDDDDDDDNEDLSDTSSVFSYTDLANAWDENDMDDTTVDELLMQYASSSDDDDENNEFIREERAKLKKAGKQFAYDVEEGDIEETAQPSQDEMAVLLEEGEDKALENDSDNEDQEPVKESKRNPNRIKQKKRKITTSGGKATKRRK